jgi:hypothetical protein
MALIGQLTAVPCQKARSKGLLNRPFKAATRVRIPLGVLLGVLLKVQVRTYSEAKSVCYVDGGNCPHASGGPMLE